MLNSVKILKWKYDKKKVNKILKKTRQKENKNRQKQKQKQDKNKNKSKTYEKPWIKTSNITNCIHTNVELRFSSRVGNICHINGIR